MKKELTKEEIDNLKEFLVIREFDKLQQKDLEDKMRKGIV